MVRKDAVLSVEPKTRSWERVLSGNACVDVVFRVAFEL
jgi:hypothetical protein